MSDKKKDKKRLSGEKKSHSKKDEIFSSEIASPKTFEILKSHVTDLEGEIFDRSGSCQTLEKPKKDKSKKLKKHSQKDKESLNLSEATNSSKCSNDKKIKKKLLDHSEPSDCINNSKLKTSPLKDEVKSKISVRSTPIGEVFNEERRTKNPSKDDTNKSKNEVGIVAVKEQSQNPSLSSNAEKHKLKQKTKSKSPRQVPQEVSRVQSKKSTESDNSSPDTETMLVIDMDAPPKVVIDLEEGEISDDSDDKEKPTQITKQLVNSQSQKKDVSKVGGTLKAAMVKTASKDFQLSREMERPSQLDFGKDLSTKSDKIRLSQTMPQNEFANQKYYKKKGFPQSYGSIDQYNYNKKPTKPIPKAYEYDDYSTNHAQLYGRNHRPKPFYDYEGFNHMEQKPSYRGKFKSKPFYDYEGYKDTNSKDFSRRKGRPKTSYDYDEFINNDYKESYERKKTPKSYGNESNSKDLYRKRERYASESTDDSMDYSKKKHKRKHKSKNKKKKKKKDYYRSPERSDSSSRSSSVSRSFKRKSYQTKKSSSKLHGKRKRKENLTLTISSSDESPVRLSKTSKPLPISDKAETNTKILQKSSPSIPTPALGTIPLPYRMQEEIKKEKLENNNILTKNSETVKESSKNLTSKQNKKSENAENNSENLPSKKNKNTEKVEEKSEMIPSKKNKKNIKSDSGESKTDFKVTEEDNPLLGGLMAQAQAYAIQQQSTYDVDMRQYQVPPQILNPYCPTPGGPIMENGVPIGQNGMPMMQNNGIPMMQNNGMPMMQNGMPMMQNGMPMMPNNPSPFINNSSMFGQPQVPDLVPIMCPPPMPDISLMFGPPKTSNSTVSPNLSKPLDSSSCSQSSKPKTTTCGQSQQSSAISNPSTTEVKKSLIDMNVPAKSSLSKNAGDNQESSEVSSMFPTPKKIGDLQKDTDLRLQHPVTTRSDEPNQRSNQQSLIDKQHSPASTPSDKEVENSENKVQRSESSSSSSSEDSSGSSVERLNQCPEKKIGQRRWQLVQPDRTPPTGNVTFTLMTYNILSQEALEYHSHLYSRCQADHLNWEGRCKRLLEQILAHGTDVICLQEVEEDSWISQLKDKFDEEGYGSFYKKKPGDKTDGCVLLYKREKFRLVKAVGVDMNRGGILDRNNTGIIALLSPEGYTGSIPWICVASTHLLFNPRRGDVKLSQLVLFLAEIDKMAHYDPRLATSRPPSSPETGSSSNSDSDSESSSDSDSDEEKPAKNSYCPIILCGDLNSEPFSDLYNFVTSGHLQYNGLISRLVCGQKEGNHGSINYLDRHLLPRSLKISQNCRYKSVEVARWRRSCHALLSSGASISKRPEFSTNTGTLHHSMNFKSVYKHTVRRKNSKISELTTYHEHAACTVDYVFYSSPTARKSKRSDSSDGSSSSDSSDDSDGEDNDLENPLVLMARYSLPTARDIKQRLPTDIFPSDHFCLIAKFMLR